MKVTNKSFYTCEIYGKTSTNEKKIQVCQESHRKITEETEIEAVYQRAKKHLQGLLLSFQMAS